MRPNHLVLVGTIILALFTSCVSKKKYKALRGSNETLLNKVDSLHRNLQRCGYEKDDLADLLAATRAQNDELRASNAVMAQAVGSMAQLSHKEAENMEKTLESLKEKDLQIRRLWEAKNARDSAMLALTVSLKGSMGDLQDQDIEINVEKGVVFISISDKLLFKSGSTAISSDANAVLSKVAAVVNARPELDFLVEGHTDNVPISRDGMKDNWDLSVLRAASIVRALQKNHGVDPARMTACGRSEYVPIAPNDTPENKARNRRTRIVVLPKLDQFSKLVEDGLEELEKQE